MDPEMMHALYAFLSANPEYTSKGNVKPVSLTEQAKRTNYQQDQMQSMANPMFAAMLGGGRGFDLSAFDDVEDGFDTYDVPNNPMTVYAHLPDSSEEKKIAVGIQQGMSPEQIVARFRDDQGYKNDKDDKALDRVRATANGMFKEQGAYRQKIESVPGFDPSTGEWSVPEGGQHIAGKLTIPKFKPSDATMIFQKAGLPTPNQEFTEQDFGWNGSTVDTEGLAQLTAKAAASKSAFENLRPDPNVGDPTRFAMLQRALNMRANAEPHHGEGIDLTMGNDMEVQHAREMMANDRVKRAPVENGMSPALEALMATAVRDRDATYARKDDPRFRRDAKGKLATAEGRAYDAYSNDLTAQRKAERAAVSRGESDKFDQAYAKARAASAKARGFTPLTLAMLQRAEALRGMGS